MKRTTIVTILGLLLSLSILSQQTSPRQLSEYQLKNVNFDMLRVIAGCSSMNDLRRVEQTIQLGDRDIQRLYWTKRWAISPDRQSGRHILDLMPQSGAEMDQFYVYTSLKSLVPLEKTLLSSEAKYDEISALVEGYFNATLQLICSNPNLDQRFAVMLYCAKGNDEVSAILWDGIKGLDASCRKRISASFEAARSVLDRNVELQRQEGLLPTATGK